MIPQTPPSKGIGLEGENAFSPINLPQSPAAQVGQKNLTGLPRVARDIAADVFNNIQKWNENHVRGSKIVKQIAITKSDIIGKYPPGLETLMKELYEIVQNLSIYANALVFLATQMKALVKLQKENTPLFISLNAEELSSLLDNISEAYKMELKEKQYVLENIPHSLTKKEVMYFASSWTHQPHITSNVNIKLETLLTETGHRKII